MRIAQKANYDCILQAFLIIYYRILYASICFTGKCNVRPLVIQRYTYVLHPKHAHMRCDLLCAHFDHLVFTTIGHMKIESY